MHRLAVHTDRRRRICQSWPGPNAPAVEIDPTGHLGARYARAQAGNIEHAAWHPPISALPGFSTPSRLNDAEWRTGCRARRRFLWNPPAPIIAIDCGQWECWGRALSRTLKDIRARPGSSSRYSARLAVRASRLIGEGPRRERRRTPASRPQNQSQSVPAGRPATAGRRGVGGEPPHHAPTMFTGGMEDATTTAERGARRLADDRRQHVRRQRHQHDRATSSDTAASAYDQLPARQRRIKGRASGHCSGRTGQRTGWLRFRQVQRPC